MVDVSQLGEGQEWLTGSPAPVECGVDLFQLDEEQEWLSAAQQVCSNRDLVHLVHQLWALGLRLWLLFGIVELLRLGHC